MERREFEESLKKAFEGAEVTPSDNAWRTVELELEREKGLTLRKRLVFYQTLAAASVIFAIAFSIGIYVTRDNSTAPTQLTVTAEQVLPPGESSPRTSTESDGAQSTSPGENPRALASGETSLKSRGSNPQRTQSSLQVAPMSSEMNAAVAANDVEPSGTVILEQRPLPPIVNLSQRTSLKLAAREERVDPVALMLARLDQREEELRDEKHDDSDENSENLWSSIGFAAGSFTSANASVSSAPSNYFLAQNSPQTREEVRASGTSYSMGVNIGKKIAPRWVLQGGVNYLTQFSDFTAQTAIRTADFTTFKPASIGQIGKLPQADFSGQEALVSTAPYNVNNNIRYLTIPVQAGYLLLNRDIALQVTAGVATDVFLQNTVSAGSGDLDKATDVLGEDTPYRPVNLSGLASTELSYKFGQNYRISLNPGIRYPLNSVYKSGFDVKASPLTFDVGLRFRYIFN